MTKNCGTDSLLSALLDCFDKLNIAYIEETKGDKYIKIINRDIVTKWEVIFCKDIVGLSIAPGSVEKRHPNRNVLGTLKRGVVNNQTITTITQQYIPHFSGSIGHKIIDAQKEHLVQILELAVCAKRSDWKKDVYSNNGMGDEYLLKDELNGRENVKPYIYQTFDLLKSLFETTPLVIITKKDKWFSSIVNERIPVDINSDESEQVFASIVAAALVLSLNIKDKSIPSDESQKVDENIKKYLQKLFSDGFDSEDLDDNHEKKKKNILKEDTSEDDETIEKEKSTQNQVFQGTVLRNSDYFEKATAYLMRVLNQFSVEDDIVVIEELRDIMGDAILAYANAVALSIVFDDADPYSTEWDKAKNRYTLLLKQKILDYYKGYIISMGFEEELEKMKLYILDSLWEIHIELAFLLAQITAEGMAIDVTSSQTVKETRERRIDKLNKKYSNEKIHFETVDTKVDIIVDEYSRGLSTAKQNI